MPRTSTIATVLCGVAALAMPLSAVRAADKPTVPAAFGTCAACHATQPGETSFGPNLRGVVGRKAAILPGYAYSKALAARNFTWTPETLDAWLKSPRAMVPGTKMPFIGYKAAEKRAAVIAYLKTLK